MHIEEGVVDGAKIVLSVATAGVSIGLIGKMAWNTIKNDGGITALATRSIVTTIAVLMFFQIFPHYPAGVSEVHFILGSTLYLMFGGGAASIGLALGLLLQGVVFEPIDLPQYGMNLTTLIVPLWAISVLAKRLIAPNTAYVDLKYSQTFALSAAFQGGVVAWVAFWATYGQGVGAENVASIATFGAAYMSVVLLEPFVDMAVLWGAKTLRSASKTPLFYNRLHNAA